MSKFGGGGGGGGLNISILQKVCVRVCGVGGGGGHVGRAGLNKAY